MKKPSIKKLEEAFPGKGKELRRILEMKRSELLLHPAGEARVRDCYHSPPTSDIRMHVLDSAAETCGVEYIASRKDTYTEFHGIDYLNTGDAYALTIVRSCKTGSYRVSSWGDIVERGGYL